MMAVVTQVSTPPGHILVGRKLPFSTAAALFWPTPFSISHKTKRANNPLQRPQLPDVPSHNTMERPDEVGFFSLPREIRDKIYKMVLILSHALHLFLEHSGSDKFALFAPERPPRRWLSLLYANRGLHKEAAETLYRFSLFTLVKSTGNQSKLLRSFLNRIGPTNTSHLGRLCINFPRPPTAVAAVVAAGPRPTLSEDSVGTLELLQTRCPNLTTLEAMLYDPNSGMTLANQSSRVRDMLKELDTRLKAIPSLCKFVINVYTGPLAPSVLESIQEYGWVVRRGR